MNDQEQLRRMLHDAVTPHPRGISEDELWIRSRRRRSGRRVVVALAGAASIVMVSSLSLQLINSTEHAPESPASSVTEGNTARPDPSADVTATGGGFDPRALLAQCLTDQGLGAHQDSEGNIVVEGAGTTALESRFTRDCAEGLNVNQPLLKGQADAAYSRAEAEELYDTYLLIRTCFTHTRLPLGDLPERDRFVAALAEGDGLIWHPYQDALAEDRLKEAMRACPMAEAEKWE